MRSWIKRNLGTVLVAAAVATTAAGGIVIVSDGGSTPIATPTPTPTATPGPGSANIWVNTVAGGLPSRCSVACSYVSSNAYGSFQAAIAACTPGDVIRVKAGVYGSQTITTDRSSACAIIAEDGTTIGSLTAGADNIDVSNFDATSVGLANNPQNFTSRDVNYGNSGISYISGPATNITFLGGSFHDIADGGNPGGVFVVGNTVGEQINNIVFDGVAFTNIDCTSTPGNHFEAIRVQAYVNGLVIRNSLFSGNAVDSSQILYSSFTGGTPHTPTGTHLIEGNYFGPTEAGTCGGAAFIQVDFSLQSGACVDLTMRYNTAQQQTLGPALGGSNCSSGFSNVKMTANIAPKGAGSCDAVFANNMWINGSSANCGTGDQTVASTAAAGLTGDGFHITSSSPARGAGKPGDCPADDRDGDTRPLPAATTCDAGADEVL